MGDKMRRLLALSVAFFATVSICSLVAGIPHQANVQAAAVDPPDPCFLPPALFGDTDEPLFQDVPPPHTVNPSDCPFYQPAWQEFLYATKPLPHSRLPLRDPCGPTGPMGPEGPVAPTGPVWPGATTILGNRKVIEIRDRVGPESGARNT